MTKKSKATISVDSRDYQLLKRILEKNGDRISNWFRLNMVSYLSDHLWQLLDDPEIELNEGERWAAHRSNQEPALPEINALIDEIENDDNTYITEEN